MIVSRNIYVKPYLKKIFSRWVNGQRIRYGTVLSGVGRSHQAQAVESDARQRDVRLLLCRSVQDKSTKDLPPPCISAKCRIGCSPQGWEVDSLSNYKARGRACTEGTGRCLSMDGGRQRDA